MSVDAPARFASPVDAGRHGSWGTTAETQVAPPRFHGRVDDLGSAASAARSRFHVYGARSCPRTHRLRIIRALAAATRSVSLSFVDDLRDGRGWAFRRGTGADPINGFSLLAEAYLATDSIHHGAVAVPVLWDREAGRIMSDDPITIGVDLATGSGSGSGSGLDLYPPARAEAIEAVGRWSDLTLPRAVAAAVYHRTARPALAELLDRLDRRVSRHDFVLGDEPTDADLRLWVRVVRYDVGPNACGRAGPGLHHWAGLSAWARRVHQLPAVRLVTDFAEFSAPLATPPAWARSEATQSSHSAPPAA